MQPQARIRESWRNAVSRPLTTTAILAVTLVGGLVSGVAELREVDNIIDDHQLLIREGYYTLQITQTNEAAARSPFTNTECQELMAANGVLTAGGTSASEPVAVGSPVGPTYAAWIADPVLLGAVSWSATGQVNLQPLTGHGAVYDSSLASQLGGIRDSATLELHTNQQQVVTDAVEGTTGVLGGGYRETIIISGDLDRIDSCIVLAAPDLRRSVETQAAALFPTSNGFLATWSTDGGATFRTPIYRLANRQTRFLGVALGIAIGMVLSALLLTRRHDAATYRLLGVSTRHTSQLLILEIGGPIITGLAISSIVTSIYSSATNSFDPTGGILQVCLYGGIVGLLVTTSTTLIANRNVIDALKDQ